jgi:hypothetical protein
MRQDTDGLPSGQRAGKAPRGDSWLPWLGRGGLFLAVAAVAAALGSRAILAQRPGVDAGPASQLWISATPLDDHRQLLLVIDPQLRNAAVYHVDAPTGTLTLKSTRNITWDLMVGDFNAQEPKPSALKKMLETGRENGPAGQNRP